MPVILLKRDGLHDIDVSRRDRSSSWLNRELSGLPETTVSRRQDDGSDGSDDGDGSSNGGGGGGGDGGGHVHGPHRRPHPNHTYLAGEATGSANSSTAQGAEPTPTTSGDPSASQTSRSSATGQDGSSSSFNGSSGVFEPTSSASGSTSASIAPITSFSSITDSSPTSTGLPSSSGGVNPQNAAAIGPNKGAIAGGVVGGVFGLAIIFIACFLLYKARQRKHMAPSSEFMTVPGNPASFSRLGTRLDDPNDMPPSFTQGNFNAPVYEKFNAAGESHLPL